MQNPGAVDVHIGFSHSIVATFSPHPYGHVSVLPESTVNRQLCRGGT